MLKYVEVKAVVGGTTAVQGSAKMAYPYEGWLVRNVEYETFKTGKKSVYQSALPLRTDADYAKQAQPHGGWRRLRLLRRSIRRTRSASSGDRSSTAAGSTEARGCW